MRGASLRLGLRLPRWPGAALAVALLVCGTAEPAGAAVGAKELKLHELVNEARAAQGLATLPFHERLSRIAERHSRRMVDRGYLFHTDLQRLFPGALAGEVVGSGPSVDAVLTELLASSSHRDVLLGASWRKTGVGIVRGRGRLWVTQILRN